MTLPPSYEGSYERDKICRLRKALDGLKQSPMAWFRKFTRTMRTLGYRQCNGDHTLFSNTFFKQGE